MMQNHAGAPHGDLEYQLLQLNHLTGRTQELSDHYNATVQRYTPADRPMKNILTQPALIGLSLAIAFGVTSLGAINLYLMLVPALVVGVGMLGLGGYGILRGGSLRPHAPFMIASGALLLFMIFVGGRLSVGPWLMLLALAAPAYLGLRWRNARCERLNQDIAVANDDARARAWQAASAELVPIEQELNSLQQAFADGNYASWYPERYLDPQSVAALWQIVHDRRARDITEAVNQHVQDQHNHHMRSSADQQAAMAQMQLQAQRNTERAVNIHGALNLGMQAFQGARTRQAINAPRTFFIRKY